MRRFESTGSFGCLLMIFTLTVAAQTFAQDAQEKSGQISLQKTVVTREYNGKSVEGQERLVSPGDSLWRILIQEKRLAEKRFGQYLNLVRRLNPQMKTADVLRVGEKVFIPLRPDETLGYQPAPVKNEAPQTAKGEVKDYIAKQGDNLTRILREQLGIADEKKLALYYNLTRDLNPQKKNWDLIQAGETIRLPASPEPTESRSAATRAPTEKTAASPATVQPVPMVADERKALPESKPTEKTTASTAATPATPMVAATNKMPTTQPAANPSGSKAANQLAPMPTTESKPPPEAKPTASATSLDYARQTARENISLIGEVVESVGNEVERSGQEVLPIKDGAVRLERNSFPIVYNRKLGQKVLLDPEEKIPDALRTQLNERNSTPVMAVSKNSSVQDAVGQLFARLGFQSLPGQQAVVIQEGGVAFEAKGQWVVLAPEESNKPQEVYVINVSDKVGVVPEYLKSHLARKGLHLREILWPPSLRPNIVSEKPDPKRWMSPVKSLPRDKRDIVDAVLLSYGIPFDAGVELSWELGQGLKIETACDRVFQWRDQETAVFFQRVGADTKKSLQEKRAIKIIELDLASLSSRDLIAKLLNELGDPAAYKEQRFPAADGSLRDRLTVITSGFLLPKQSILLTDREIPEEFHRFFFEKGWEIVYFQ